MWLGPALQSCNVPQLGQLISSLGERVPPHSHLKDKIGIHFLQRNFRNCMWFLEPSLEKKEQESRFKITSDSFSLNLKTKKPFLFHTRRTARKLSIPKLLNYRRVATVNWTKQENKNMHWWFAKDMKDGAPLFILGSQKCADFVWKDNFHRKNL